MNFQGWVAIPRSMLNNTHTGALSNNEQLALMTLTLLADAKTGSGYINAPVLRTYLPELSYPAAKRVLKSLEDKRVLFRQIKHASTDLYRYWLHGYPITGDGQDGMRWTNLTEVFAKQDVRAIKYDKTVPELIPEAAPELIPETVPEAIPETVPNNNTENMTKKYKDKTLPVKGNGDDGVDCLSSIDAGSPSGTICGGDGASGGRGANGASCQGPPVTTMAGIQYAIDDGFIDVISGARLSEVELNPRIEHLGLRLVNGSFSKIDTGERVFLRHALPLITANPTERIAA